MSRIEFYYSLEKDVGNYLQSVYRFVWQKHGNKDIEERVGRFLFPEELTSIRGAENKREARIIVRKILSEKYAKNKKIYLLQEKLLRKLWREKEQKFYSRIERFFEKPFSFSKITAYFTTLPICPYSLKENWFMVSLKMGIEKQLSIICHELFHFMFLSYYEKYTYKKLKNKKKVEMLKEALTVFLNTEFREFILVPDLGYPQEQELRRFLLTKRKLNKDFLGLLNEAISFLARTET